MKDTFELVLSFLGLLVLISLVLSTDVYATPTLAAPGPLGFGYAELHEPISTDRPGFTDTTKTVQTGHLQIETGYQYIDDDDLDFTEHTFGTNSFRLGVHDIAELRFLFNGYQDVSDGDTNSYGIGDLTLGTKIRVFEACECNFEVSTILDLTLPTGSSDLSQDDVSGRGTLVWAYGWESDFSLGGNLNLDIPVDDGDYFVEPSGSLSLSYAINEKWGSYIEYGGFYPTGGNAPSTAPRHFTDGGFTYLLSENIQLDALAGFGINDSAEDFFTGCGISFRL